MSTGRDGGIGRRAGLRTYEIPSCYSDYLFAFSVTVLAFRYGSLRVQKLLKDAQAAEAKAGTNRPIIFETLSNIGSFQGDTNYTDGPIVIRVPPRSSPEYDDALKAHDTPTVI